MSDGKRSDQVLISNGIVEKNGKFLMVKRDREWDEKAHNKWEIPGGKVDFGEKPGKAAVREVEEETGFMVKSPRLLENVYTHVWEYNSRMSQIVIFPYLCELEGGEKDVSDKNVKDVDWFTREEIRELECLPGTEEMLDMAL